MLLHSLSIQHFRNLSQVEISPSKTLNLITGDNASGKTSLLESIYYLSHLRSFRTQHISDLIQRDQPYLQLVANLQEQESRIPLGIRRSRNRCEIRINRQPVKRVSDIAAQFPVIAIHPDSYILISGSPSERRHFLDWGVFHVEHSFLRSWQRYRKAVQQRNAALKAKQKPEYCQLWNQEICRTAEHIHSLRRQYFDSLQPYLNELTSVLFKDDDISISYRRGWPKDQELPELLEQNLEREGDGAEVGEEGTEEGRLAVACGVDLVDHGVELDIHYGGNYGHQRRHGGDGAKQLGPTDGSHQSVSRRLRRTRSA